MSTSPTSSTSDSPAEHSILIGSLFGLLAAIGYTAANVFLRAAAATQDPYWVSAMKAVPTVLIFAPWLLVRASRALPLSPPPRALMWLVATGALGQVGGNVLFQWALGVIGIAITVPLSLGSMIVSGAAFGWWMLGEKVPPRNMIAIAVLVVAVAVLSLGAPQAQASITLVQGAHPLRIAAGVAAALFSGFTYALLGVAIRNAARRGGPATATLVAVGLTGVLLLMPMAYARIGWPGMLATTRYELAMMIGAGLSNAAAFLFLIQSLKMTSIVHSNALNATQATMASIAGILIFGEPFSGALTFGVLLTALGLLLTRPPVTPPVTPD